MIVHHRGYYHHILSSYVSIISSQFRNNHLHYITLTGAHFNNLYDMEIYTMFLTYALIMGIVYSIATGGLIMDIIDEHQELPHHIVTVITIIWMTRYIFIA